MSFTAELMVSGNGGCWDSALPCAGTSPQIPCVSLRGVNQTQPNPVSSAAVALCVLCSVPVPSTGGWEGFACLGGSGQSDLVGSLQPLHCCSLGPDIFFPA